MTAKKIARASASPQKRPGSRILLADGNVLSARLLSQALEKSSAYQVLGCAVDRDSLYQAMREQTPDILLVSVHFVESAGSRFRWLRELIDDFPQVPSVVLLDQSDRDTVVDAFRAGAKGVFLCSKADVESLKKCVRRVLEGQIWADTAQLHFIVSALPSLHAHEGQARARRVSKLTAREEQVVRCVAEGMGNREIAAQLKLQENTIKNYVFRIYDKLGISNRVELALYAMKGFEDPHRKSESGAA
ncbi:MAG TPA: response regulator transcription factor [Candidatus Eisenbacteria bacterium]|nr:response regulator transcription factor [Candidatus Eisenbacteria bacterium]